MNLRQVRLAEMVTPQSVMASVVGAPAGQISYAEDTGYHIYGELRLGLRLSAADDTRSAQQYLKVLEHYTLVAEVAAAIEGAHILEVQGERIHAFIPAQVDEKKSVDRAIRFCVAMTDQVYAQVAPSAGKSFDGFGMAAAHGRTVFVQYGSGPGMSIISLSPAANEPAKCLGTKPDGTRRIPAKHLAIPADSLRRAGHATKTSGRWEILPLDPLPQEIISTRDQALIERISTAIGQEARQLLTRPAIAFRAVDEAFLGQTSVLSSGQAIRISCLFLRADLSGFTKQVASAFASGPTAVLSLVQRFTKIMMHAERFSTNLAAPNHIRLPWAGDCANLGLVPPYGKPYADARENLPCDIPAQWHSHWRLDSERALLGSETLVATWAVACAGGDEDDSGLPPVSLVAVLRGRTRGYLVAAGWSVGRTFDALDTPGVSGLDSVIPEEDWAALSTQRRSLFKTLDTRFRITAKPIDYDAVRRLIVRSAQEPKQIAVGSTGLFIPGAKPHYA
jgi:hypothetical protein